MRVLVVGATGCIGRAVVHALRARGQTVIAAARSVEDGPRSMHVDYTQSIDSSLWSRRLQEQRIDAVVNCVGVLIETGAQTFDRLHALGPSELFRGAAAAGVSRIVQVSALGVGDVGIADPPYITSKREADRVLGALPIRYAVMRPSLVYGPGSSSAAMFAALASLPVITLPGRGEQAVQPIHVFEVAESIARWLEHESASSGVFELAGPSAMSYREMLASYRQAMGLGAALWLPLPLALTHAGARIAEALPQRVFSRDTLRLLERGNTATHNAAPGLLKRAPSPIGVGLQISPPVAPLDLRVQLSPAVSWLLRSSVALLWLVTAVISAIWPQQSGVLALLARCGFEGDIGVAVWMASCTLNAALAVAILHRPGAWTYAVQIGAVFGYTLTAAVNMPELAIDHCGPLLKNIPLVAMLVLLWLATPAPSPRRESPAGRRRADPVVAANANALT